MKNAMTELHYLLTAVAEAFGMRRLYVIHGLQTELDDCTMNVMSFIAEVL